MAVTETKYGTYLVEVPYPKAVQPILGKRRFRKTVPTEAEGYRLQSEISNKIQKVLETGTDLALSRRGDISFKDFYQQEWLPIYEDGGSGRTTRIPSKATLRGTKDIFRLHLLPLFGRYSLNELNNNTDLVLNELAFLSKTYANIKTVKSYVNQLFDVAEGRRFIDHNRVASVLRMVGDPKKQQLRKKRVAEGQALTKAQTVQWLDAAKMDFQDGALIEEDYVLIVTTLYMGLRKSEIYASQWQHVNLANGEIEVSQSLTNRGTELGPTKGRKVTIFKVPDVLVDLLKVWKEHQANELAMIGITKPTSDQFVFTYTDFQGHLNKPLHPDYLNHRLNKIEERHPELPHLWPHKLRHTFATVAHQEGVAKQAVSDHLTHSNLETTEIYLNAPEHVGLEAWEGFAAGLAEGRQQLEKKLP